MERFAKIFEVEIKKKKYQVLVTKDIDVEIDALGETLHYYINIQTMIDDEMWFNDGDFPDKESMEQAFQEFTAMNARQALDRILEIYYDAEIGRASDDE